MSTDSLKVQFHPKLGAVVWDPIAQIGLAPEQVRLLKLSSMTTTTFMKTIVSKDLAACSEEVLAQNTQAVANYRAARAARRKPYCEQCRRHYGSVDFTVCGGCSAIRCSCGACSCVSRRRRAA